MSVSWHWTVVSGCKVKQEFVKTKIRGCGHPETKDDYCGKCRNSMWQTEREWVGDDKFVHFEDLKGAKESWHRYYGPHKKGWMRVQTETEDHFFVGKVILEISSYDHGYTQLDPSIKSKMQDPDPELVRKLTDDGFKILKSGIFVVCWAC